jgi:hypothetical protein
MTPAEMISAYLQIRDKKRLLEERHKQELKPFNEGLAQLENALAKAMDETGLTNLPGQGGTAYRATRSSVTVADWDSFITWVREAEAWHVLEHRANKTAIDEILNDNNDLPPGLNVTRTSVVNVRKT